MKNEIAELFRRYGWMTETLGENSYIAYNETFFVAYSYDPYGYVSSVSYLACDKEDFIQAWKKYNEDRVYPTPIGYYAWHMVANRNNRFMHFGGVCNHDHSAWEIENWLERLGK